MDNDAGSDYCAAQGLAGMWGLEGAGGRPRAAKWVLPAHFLWKCREGAGANPGPGAEPSCDTLSILISHFFGLLSHQDGTEPTSHGTVPGTEWHWTRTLTASILQQHLMSLPSHPEMRFCSCGSSKEKPLGLLKRVNIKKYPKITFCSQAR